MRSRAPFSRLYPILDAALESEDSIGASVEALARAGCRLVQLRAKGLSARELLRWAELAVAAARSSGIEVIINDRADVALISGARGVHLGQDDLSVAGARRVLGNGAIVGLSTHDVDEAKAADRLDVDYVAIGPAYATRSKARPDTPLGPDGIREVRAVVGKPLVAIGGITRSRLPEILATGVEGVAVISALKRTTNLEEEARWWMSVDDRSDNENERRE